MKLYATVTSERASKGQGGNEYIDIDLFDGNQKLLGRVVLLPDAYYGKGYVLVEDISLRSKELRMDVQNGKVDGFQWCKQCKIRKQKEEYCEYCSPTKGEKQKGEDELSYCNNCEKDTYTDEMGTCRDCRHDN